MRLYQYNEDDFLIKFQLLTSFSSNYKFKSNQRETFLLTASLCFHVLVYLYCLIYLISYIIRTKHFVYQSKSNIAICTKFFPPKRKMSTKFLYYLTSLKSILGIPRSGNRTEKPYNQLADKCLNIKLSTVGIVSSFGPFNIVLRCSPFNSGSFNLFL